MGALFISKFRNITAVAIVLMGAVPACIYSLEKSVSLERDTKARTEAVLTFTKMPDDMSLSKPVGFVVTPSAIGETAAEKKRWKELFAWGRYSCGGKKPAEILEKIIAAQLKNAEPDGVFIKKALRAIVPFAQGIELNELHVLSGKIRLERTDCCDCCQVGRYHLELVGQSDVMKCRTLPIVPDSNKFFSTISATAKIVPNKLSQWLFVKSIEKDSGLTAKSALYQCALSIFHEIVHAARLDHIITQSTQATSNITLSIRHATELQADCIPLLLLQDDNYFLSCAEFFSSGILISLRECMILRSKYAPENTDFLKAVYEDAQQEATVVEKAVLTALYQLYLAEPQEYKQLLLEQSCLLLSKTHPHYHVRLHKVLTMWAAYLIHENSWEHNEAVDYIHDLLISTVFCWKVPEKYSGRLNLLKTVIHQWADSARICTSSLTAPAGKKRKQPAG